MTTATADFTTGPLYAKAIHFLPIYVQDPFSAKPTLNVKRLMEATGKSHEAVYKWFRKSVLTPENATALVALANSPENVEILKRLDRTPPTIQDFHEFVFGA